MTLYIKGTDTVIVGTREQLTGIAIVNGFADDGSIVWEGTTEIDWNDQFTIIENGQPIWVGEDKEDYRGVTVEDRREDGTVVPYLNLSDDPLDDLQELLNLAVAKTAAILEANPEDKVIQATLAVTSRHLQNITTGLEATRRSLAQKPEVVAYVAPGFTDPAA